MTQLRIDKLRMDARTQARTTINQDVVEDYTEAVLAGCTFPPIDVFLDELRNYWPADGWHRIKSHVAAGHKTIMANVHQGDERAAILFAVGANVKHGFRRSNEDKRRAVAMLLVDVEWSSWSDREIARRCGVSNGLVSILRQECASVKEKQIDCQEHGETQAPPSRLVNRGGTTYEMKTGGIGTKKVIEQVREQAKCALCGQSLAL